MKKGIVMVLAAAVSMFGGSFADAQGKYGADSAECIKYISYYSEYFKQKNYDQALPNWRQAYKLCPPQARQSILIDGTTLIRRVISQNARNAAYRKALIDTLMTLHDKRAEFYPKYAVTALNNKGTDISNYFKDDANAIYTGLNSIIEANGSNTKSTILLFNLNSAIDLYQLGHIDTDEVISVYQRNIGIITEAMDGKSDVAMDEKVKSDMESLFIGSKVASCDNLIALFTPRYEAAPDDATLASNIVKMMASTEDCTDNDLFLKAATTMHNTQPSAQSAYFLYRLNASRDNSAEAMKFMEEAVSYEDLDAETAADYNLQYATYCVKSGMGPKGLAAAEKAASLDPSKAGKAYYLIGTIWSGFNCGGDEISSRAKYWVACDYMQKAIKADESLAEDCNNMIRQYSVYFPKAADAFMYDVVNGQSYTVNCNGLKAQTIVRTQK